MAGTFSLSEPTIDPPKLPIPPPPPSRLPPPPPPPAPTAHPPQFWTDSGGGGGVALGNSCSRPPPPPRVARQWPWSTAVQSFALTFPISTCGSVASPLKSPVFRRRPGDLEFFPFFHRRPNFDKEPPRKLLLALEKIGSKNGTLPEHVPFFTHFPPIFLFFLSSWNIFIAFFMLYSSQFPISSRFPPFPPLPPVSPHFPPFPPIFAHLPAFSPFFHVLPESGRPPETETSKDCVVQVFTSSGT